MRSYERMMELILQVAMEDERVRAVGMNGSRANPNTNQDIFMDYDIVYLVTDLESFIINPDWINVFGERIIMQKPDEMVLFPSQPRNRFAYLMLFTDGNRIDLTLIPAEDKLRYCREDSLTVILLDKDEAMPDLAAPSDRHYWVKQPSAEMYAGCCNEFWWVTTYVAKGLWRNEIIYAQDHMNICRKMLLKMLEWEVGMKHGYSISLGKCGKHLQRYAGEDIYQKLLHTYSDGNVPSIWEALSLMIELFRTTSRKVAAGHKFSYPNEEDRRVTQYLMHVRSLPSDTR